MESKIELEEGRETVDLQSEVKTQVTSIAKEEEKTGQKIDLPKGEELAQRASMSLIKRLSRIEQMLSSKDPRYKVSARDLKRAIIAGINLPSDGLPVQLKSNESKELFALIQGAISDRFILMQYHISEELKKQKAKAAQDKTEEQSVEEESKKENTNE